jgi:hypothetical protein
MCGGHNKDKCTGRVRLACTISHAAAKKNVFLLHTRRIALQQQKCLFDYGWKLPAASRIDAPFMPNKTALWLTTAPAAAARLFCCDVFWPLLAQIHKQHSRRKGFHSSKSYQKSINS